MNPLRDIELDLAKFEFLWPKAYPYYSRIPFITKFMKKLVKDDILQFGQMFEQAISKQCKLIRESTVGRDFKEGYDAKLISVRTNTSGYSGNVSNIFGKSGSLLVGCYERKQKKWYFFNIPRNAYKHIPKTSNIEIPFELNGDPRRLNKSRVNWWKYEVDSINKLV